MTVQGFELLGLLPIAYSYTSLIGEIIFNMTLCNDMLELCGKCILLQFYISLGHLICIHLYLSLESIFHN
jgi:hypothetical protein